MDYLIENTEEEAARLLRRKERMERMRREKQLQLRRRKRMKIVAKRMTVGLAAVLAVFFAFTLFRGGENKKTEEETLSQAEASVVQAEVVKTEESSLENAVPVSIPLGDKEQTIKYDFTANADTKTVYDEEIASEHIILVEEDSDTIVASKGSKERISPASMTKVLTILVAAENLTEDQLEDRFTMTREITDYGYVNDCSSVGFLDGEAVAVKDLFYGTILPSGCDAAVGLATYVAGSHEAFVEMMNEKLEKLGISDSTHFTNCVGLYDEEHYSTVYDMAVIMKAAVENEFCKEVLSEHNYITTPTTEHPEGIDISNWFLRRIEDKDTGGEVLCAKTGYVMQSKNCAVSYEASANGKNYICVTAGSTSTWKCIYDHVNLYKKYVSA